MSRTFPAAYPGRCEACNDRIEPDDVVAYTRQHKRPVHDYCTDVALGRIPAEVCPSCHLTSCDCEL